MNLTRWLLMSVVSYFIFNVLFKKKEQPPEEQS